METEDGTVLYWLEPDATSARGRNQFAVFDSAASAESRFGSMFALGLVHP